VTPADPGRQAARRQVAPWWLSTWYLPLVTSTTRGSATQVERDRALIDPRGGEPQRLADILLAQLRILVEQRRDRGAVGDHAHEHHDRSTGASDARDATHDPVIDADPRGHGCIERDLRNQDITNRRVVDRDLPTSGAQCCDVRTPPTQPLLFAPLRYCSDTQVGRCVCERTVACQPMLHVGHRERRSA
jgi:hypothetical protein